MLSDQSLGQARVVVDRPADVVFATKRLVLDGAGRRLRALHRRTRSGVSPMAIPGCRRRPIHGRRPHAQCSAARRRAAPSDHLAQLDKRQRKLDAFNFGDHWARLTAKANSPSSPGARSPAPRAKPSQTRRADGLRRALVRAAPAGAGAAGTAGGGARRRQTHPRRRADPRRPVPPLSARPLRPAGDVSACSIGRARCRSRPGEIHHAITEWRHDDDLETRPPTSRPTTNPT